VCRSDHSSAQAGVLGVAVGFGAQGFVRDVIAGMFYLMDDAFRVGEYISAGNYKGTVEGFSIRSVKLRHHRGPVYTVPFSLLGGFEASVMGPFREGAPITWTFHLEDGLLNVENYFLNVEIHEEALQAAGFRDVRWHQPMLSPAGDAGYGRDYWSTLLDHPPVIFIECFLAKS
jgi:small-conductance mechanosensitive channel